MFMCLCEYTLMCGCLCKPGWGCGGGASEPRELELQVVGICHVHTGNPTDSGAVSSPDC